jgi:hypothetical protein
VVAVAATEPPTSCPTGTPRETLVLSPVATKVTHTAKYGPGVY